MINSRWYRQLAAELLIVIIQTIARELWRRALRHGPWFDAFALDIGNTVPLVQSRGNPTYHQRCPISTV